MKAKDIMMHEVVSVEPDADALRAVRLMLQHRVSGLPVIRADGELVGIVTEGDFLRRTETGTERKRPRWLELLMGPGRLADEYVRSHAHKVHELMTRDPVVVSEDTSVSEIVETMERKRIKRVPVVRDGRVVGIVSRANLMHALASIAHDAPAQAPGDEEIRRQLLAHLRSQTWAPTGSINVVVSNGEVGLWGTIMDDRERQALVVAAENTPGVTRVVDHLVWVDPNSGTVFLSPVDEKESATAP